MTFIGFERFNKFRNASSVNQRENEEQKVYSSSQTQNISEEHGSPFKLKTNLVLIHIFYKPVSIIYFCHLIKRFIF